MFVCCFFDRHLVEEENDQLRVQRANDASTIQELKLLLDDKTQGKIYLYESDHL